MSEAPIRVLMLVDGIGPDAGGGERMAIGLAGALARQGHRVTIVVTRGEDEPGSSRPELEADGVRVIALHRPGRLGLRGFGPLRKLMRSEDFDVLHSHKFGSNVWGVLFGRLHRVPVIVAHEQTWSYQGNPARLLIDGVIGRLASVFVAVSSADRERMTSRERVPARKTRLMLNAYVPRPQPPEPGDLRAELGLPAGTPIVGTAAVLRPQKALGVLIDAFAELSRSHPDAHLVIAGKGERREKLGRVAADRGVAERTHFLGRREDIETLLEAFDVAAMSSDFEGTPLFAVECMVHGTPLVATRVGGLPDLITDGVTGRLVPPRDPSALAAALDELLSDPDRRLQLAEAARARAAELEIDRVAERFAGLYSELLGDRG